MNIFRLAADLAHLVAIVILLLKMWKSRSCEGISGRSQALFALVFVSRYLDLFTNFYSVYNTLMKAFFLVSSFGTVYLMWVKFKATYDRNNDTLRVEFLIIPAALLAVLINHERTLMEVMWTFSIYLESVAIMPQLFMLSRTGNAETITAHYLFALGSYRALYIVNWIYRFYTESFFDPIAVVAGIVQTVLYADFFYLYVTRDGNSQTYQGDWKSYDTRKVNSNKFRQKRQNDLNSTIGTPIQYDALAASVNKSLDPCDDFYQFVCDGWKKKYPVPKDQLNYNQMYVLNDQLNEAIRDVLTHKNKSLGREFQLMYTYFDKCVEYQEDPGDDGLKDLFKKLRRYHSPSIKTLTDFLIASFPTQTFFKFSIDLDPENSTVKVFAISPHSSTLSFDQYFNEDIASSRDLYNAMISQTLTMLAEESENKDELFSKDTAARMLRAYTIVDMNLAKIINDSDGIKGENMQLEDISLKFKAIDWIKYLNAALSKSGWNYVKTKGILIEGPLLIKKYEDFISELDENVLRDYLDVRTVIAAMNDLPKKYQDLYEKLMEQYYGVVTLDKQKACFENIKEIFPDLLSVVYVDKYFNKSSIDDIAKLVNVIRNTMIEMLDEEGWMNFFTREKAKLKAENIAEIIAYDPQMYNETKRKEKYQNLTFTDSTSYYVINNIVEIWTLNMEIEDVSTPFGRGTVEFNAVEVNAFYQPQTNMIILLAGILHPPFFNASLPTILNYASMGLIVGHELTHAFDDTGSKFDEVGNMVNWWDTRTEEDFVNKTKCFEQQYGNITVVDGKRIRINGHDTLGENIADNGGVKLTIRAMQKVLDESKFHIVGLEEFTIEQLFFMVYGFSWCGNVKEEGLVQQVTTDVHSPDKQVLITFLLIL